MAQISGTQTLLALNFVALILEGPILMTRTLPEQTFVGRLFLTCSSSMDLSHIRI
jgi:hypothetical protein